MEKLFNLFANSPVLDEVSPALLFLNQLTTQTTQYFTQTPRWELISALMALIYVYYEIKENSACWFWGGAASLIGAVLFWQSHLYMETLMYIFYVLSAVWGYLHWRGIRWQVLLNRQSTRLPVTTCPIKHWPFYYHLGLSLGIASFALLIGALLKRYSNADLPYLDSLTTCFAFAATILSVYKIKEYWFYWLVINAASLYLYYLKGFYFFMLLMVVYTVLSLVGLIHWQRRYQIQLATTN